MDGSTGNRPKARNLTIMALLVVFVTAALLALAGRLLPGRVGRLVRQRAGRNRSA